MNRESVLKTVLVIAGVLFVAGVIPLTMLFSRQPALAMMMSLYVTLGIFLLLSARNPADNRNLIAFAGWANVAHAGVMAVQEARHVIQRQEWLGVVVFGLVGILLIVLTPAKQESQKTLSARA